MKYNKDILTILNVKQQFTEWAKNLSEDLKNKPEDPNVKNLFPNSDDGDVATVKDLVGNFLVLLTGEEVEL